jgi:hypothetical protein
MRAQFGCVNLNLATLQHCRCCSHPLSSPIVISCDAQLPVPRKLHLRSRCWLDGGTVVCCAVLCWKEVCDAMCAAGART